MNKLFKEVKDINTEACVSIILNTHRTKPDNHKDPIQLKNLIKEAITRLYNDYDKRFVWPIEERMNKIAEQIDHSENIESLIIYVNPTYTAYTRLPVPVKDRVIIDNTFATRDLIRTSYEEGGYYVLQLSRSTARLIEAFNNKVVKELGGDFPFENTQEGFGSPDLDNESNYIKEFFNRVDKSVQKILKENPLPVIIVTESRNYDYYMEVADNKSRFVANINRLPNDEKADKIVNKAWETMANIINERNAGRIEEIEKAKTTGDLVLDYNEIWRAIRQGRGKTLFIKKGFTQPAVIDTENHAIDLIDDPKTSGAVDDIIDEMIEQMVTYHGDIVFIKGDDLDVYNNLALVTR